MTCPTGSSLHNPRLMGRNVIPATRPYRSAHSVSSRRGTAASPTRTSEISAAAALNLCSQRHEPLVDPLVAALDLSDVLNDGVALRREGGEQHRHAGADIGTLDDLPAERRGARDYGAMRIAEYDARAHADQLVDEEQPGLEQLLENQQQSFALGRDHDRDGHEIGRKRRPGSVLEFRDVAAEVRPDATFLAGIHDELIAVEPWAHTQSLEGQKRRPEVIAAYAVDRQRTARHGREPDERSDLDMIGTDRMRRRFQRAAALDREGVGADAVYACAHGDEKPRQILHVRLRRGVAEHGRATRLHRRHQRVLGTGDTRLVEEDVAPLELAFECVGIAHGDRSAEALEREEMRVDASPTDDIAARRGQRHAAEAREHWPGEQNRRPNLLGQRRIERARLRAPAIHLHRVGPMPLDDRTEALQQREQRFDVADARHVVDAAWTVGEESGCENRKSRVLVARGADGARERASPRDTERRWHRCAQATRALAPPSSVRERWPSCIP